MNNKCKQSPKKANSWLDGPRKQKREFMIDEEEREEYSFRSKVEESKSNKIIKK